MRARHVGNGADDNQFGLRLGDIRKVAKPIKKNHELALALWETGNVDARLLATLVMVPKALSADEVDRLVRSLTFVQVTDWLNAYVVKHHPDKETLRQGWIAADDPWASRAGWTLTAERVVKNPDGRSRFISIAGSHRVRNANRRSGSTVDDEHGSRGNWHPYPRISASAPSPSERPWASIATILVLRAVSHPLPRSGSTQW